MTESNSSTLTRRTFLKATAMTAGAAAVVGTAGCSTIAEQSEEAAEQASGEKTYVNWCRGNCGGPCNLTGTVREGKLVKTSPTIMPEGSELLRRGCVRGHSGPQRIYGTNRVLYPMLQKGERGSDNWERISWDEAFELVGEKFKAAMDEFGPTSVVASFGCGNSTGLMDGWLVKYGPYQPDQSVGPMLLMKRAGFTETVYSSDATFVWMTSLYLQNSVNSVEDVEYSNAVFMWGSNPPEAWTSGWPFICAAKENGAKLVCIDPVYTKAAAGSDIWVPIRQGTDAALALAMCNYIIDNDLIDYDYLRNGSVAPLLVKEDGTYLRLSEVGLDLVERPDATGKSTPTDTEVVYDEAAGTFGSSFEIKNPVLNGTFEVNGITVRTVYDVVLEYIKPFTVEWAAEECGLSVELIKEISELYATSKPAKIISNCGLEHVANSWRFYYNVALLASLSGNACIPGGGYSGGASMSNTNLKRPLTLNKQAIENVKDPKPNPGITLERLPEVIEKGTWAGEDYPVKCLFVVSENILGSQLGPNEMKKAFEKLDFIVVADPLMTYTTKYADLILPVSLSWESLDHNGVFMLQKAVEPMGECKDTFEIFKGIAEALGYDDLYTKTKEEYLREILDTPENIEAGVAFDDYMEQGAIIGGIGPDIAPGMANVNDLNDVEQNEDGGKLKGTVGTEYNPTGRTQFFMEKVMPTNDFGQTFELIDRMPYYTQAFEAYKDNPLREKYPLFGINGFHNHYFGQSFLGNIPWLDELRGYEGEPYMRMHPKAAAERGIAMGDTVKVFNDHGYVVCRAVLSTGIREDTIITPHGYSHDQYIEGDPQDLTWLALDDITSNNNYNDFLCQVEKM